MRTTTTTEGASDDSSANNHEDDEPPPKPVSSSSSSSSSDSEEKSAENDNDDKSGNRPSTTTTKSATAAPVAPAPHSTSTPSSRLFAPYRTVGVVCSGAPFHLVPHQNSAQAVVACAIGDRFQLLQTNRLHPVLVSQAVTVDESKTQADNTAARHPVAGGGERCIRHVVTDAALSIAVAAHGPAARGAGADTVTLFQRTRPLTSRRLTTPDDGGWRIRDVVSMGRVPIDMTSEDVEKAGRKENAAVMAVILAKDDNDSDDDSGDDSSVGSSDSSSSSEADDSSNDDNDETTTKTTSKTGCLGRIVVLIATRTSLRVHRTVSLPSIPTFLPHTAVHPATYLNKILLGGSDRGQAAACLVNVRSGKVVHVFRCLGVPAADAESGSSSSSAIVRRS